MKHLIIIYLQIALLVTAISCQHTNLPTEYLDSSLLPHTMPDYTNGITIPQNIAPLTFKVTEEADIIITKFSYRENELICEGVEITPDIDKWHRLTELAAGDSILVEVYAAKQQYWTRYKPFYLHVSKDGIDPWISYRLIPPSYVSYEEITINQRCLENYDERVIYDNRLCSSPSQGQCVNCHHYQQYNPKRFQMHARQNHGGTFISIDGKNRKVNLKRDSTLSAGVYPAWHPNLNLIVYSTNKTLQSFHTRDINKIEVLDAASDLILYDIEKDEVTHVEHDSHEFETFPCWAPDGKMLYYCSAHYEYTADTVDIAEIITHASDIKYAIWRKSFDPQSKTFGPRELVYDPTVNGQSATLPRISPDGRWLMFTQGEWGCFHIWHRDADLWLLDLQTLQARPLRELNSSNVESYHAWSSNGRWVIFSSRRNDGVYTRPFIAHIDAQGQASKPFELPTAYPDYHQQLMKSYNIPEFMLSDVELTPQQIADILKQ